MIVVATWREEPGAAVGDVAGRRGSKWNKQAAEALPARLHGVPWMGADIR